MSKHADIMEIERACLSYVSANRDDELFDDPLRFDVGRDPQQALGIRVWRALLPGGRAGPHGGELRICPGPH
jgi:cytochrome P450